MAHVRWHFSRAPNCEKWILLYCAVPQRMGVWEAHYICHTKWIILLIGVNFQWIRAQIAQYTSLCRTHANTNVKSLFQTQNILFLSSCVQAQATHREIWTQEYNSECSITYKQTPNTDGLCSSRKSTWACTLKGTDFDHHQTDPSWISIYMFYPPPKRISELQIGSRRLQTKIREICLPKKSKTLRRRHDFQLVKK